VSYKRDIARLIRKLDGLLAEEEIAVIAAYHARGEFGLAVEQIGTRLHDLDVAIDCALAGEIASVCRKWQIPPRQWEFIYELTSGSTGGDGARALPAPPDPYGEFVRGDIPVSECVRRLRENGADDLSIVRILRAKYGLGPEGAVGRLKPCGAGPAA
jgi:hypothetical protein